MSKRSREKRATTRGAYEPAENDSLERAFAEARGDAPAISEPPAYPFDDEEGDE